MDSNVTGFEWLGVLVFVVLAWIIPAYFVGKAAHRKKRSFGAFFAISLLIGWVLAGIIVAIMKKED